MRGLNDGARRRRGFTLIELLVVVGIIAILAAIAVPNMLAAQVRAKVSRVHADLRTLATGIEAYSVDYGRCPYDGEPGFTFYGWVNALGQMTTPVAYLTSLPPAAFQDSTVTEPTLPGHTHFIDYPTRRTHTYDYSSAYWNDLPNNPFVGLRWMRNFGASAWKMSSCGPDLRHVNGGSEFGMDQIYDPTNGTVSMGDIVRSQAGAGGAGGP